MRLQCVLGAAVAAASVALTACGDTNSYWYCYDTGPKNPHHVGHPITGDHVCSDSELKGTGFSPR